MTDRKPWTADQDTIILALIAQLGTSQWTAIASQMRISCASSRSSKQIRQRWYNQLSPNITRSPWSTQEQTLLFASHERLGNKWKDIAAQLAGRTDNAVKNHFYSTVRRALRRMDKHFGFRESTKKIRNLKPAALTHLLEAASTLPDFSEMMDMLLKFAQWKPSRKSKQIQPEHSRQVYTKIIQMINAYNQNYERGRKIYTDDIRHGTKHQEVEVQHQTSNDNQSTVSDGEEEEGEDNQSVNYFGRAEQPQNWFNIQQKDYELDLCVKGLGILCEEDNYE